MANVAVNTTISARDAASGNINKVNNSLKALKIGFAAVGVAAAGFAKFAFDAVKSAAEDEMSNAKLNAALKVRGFLTDDLSAKITQQTLAMAAYGITDDQVRAGIEVGSRFFKDQATILRANSIAAQIATATGSDLSSVMEILGKAAQGNTKGLKALGIETTKTVKKTIFKTKTDELGHKVTIKTIKLTKQAATIEDILSAAAKKYGGIADDVANTTGGKYLAAQVNLNEKFEKFGYKLLPAVNEALTFMTDHVLPALDTQLTLIGSTLDKTTTEHFDPFKTQLDKFAAIFSTGGGGGLIQFGNERYWNNVFKPMNDAIDAARASLYIFNTAYEFFLKLMGKPIPGTVTPTMVVGAGGAVTSTGTGSYGPGSASTPAVVTTVNIGTAKVDTVVSDAIHRIGYGGGRP
jgi:hypothetical protein